MRKLFYGMMGAAALALSTAGNAAVIVTGSSMTTTTTTTGPTTNIAYADTGLANSFTEWLTFTNDVAAYYNITATTAAASVNFSSIVLTGPGGSTYNLVKQFDNGLSEHWGLASLLTLGVGSYTLTLNGSNSSTGGLAGDIDITAVPEPATWAMLLIGFGAVGFAMRRRTRPALAQIA